ncbi:glucosamine-6-phosphate deaminase [candidate division KSB1 bacterium]|nr:glucosamine-6-phosphate deaminase [candidate division KSB1 bacterium]
MNNVTPNHAFKVDQLQVKIYDSSISMGQAASDFVAGELNRATQKRGYANLIFATGASQFKFIDAFKKDKTVDWARITVFHLDEYKGMSDQHPASFRRYLKERILDEVKPQQIYFLNGDVDDIDAEVTNYERLLKQHPVDVACIGIGENGHIAFNDPPVADFNDPKLVKVLELDEACRKQQLGEGWFDTIHDVPTHALSLTIPAIMQCQAVSTAVPDLRKADAVYNTLNSEISTSCPATILRTHPKAVLFLDPDSASKLEKAE